MTKKRAKKLMMAMRLPRNYAEAAVKGRPHEIMVASAACALIETCNGTPFDESFKAVQFFGTEAIALLAMVNMKGKRMHVKGHAMPVFREDAP